MHAVLDSSIIMYKLVIRYVFGLPQVIGQGYFVCSCIYSIGTSYFHGYYLTLPLQSWSIDSVKSTSLGQLQIEQLIAVIVILYAVVLILSFSFPQRLFCPSPSVMVHLLECFCMVFMFKVLPF